MRPRWIFGTVTRQINKKNSGSQESVVKNRSFSKDIFKENRLKNWQHIHVYLYNNKNFVLS